MRDTYSRMSVLSSTTKMLFMFDPLAWEAGPVVRPPLAVDDFRATSMPACVAPNLCLSALAEDRSEASALRPQVCHARSTSRLVPVPLERVGVRCRAASRPNSLGSTYDSESH